MPYYLIIYGVGAESVNDHSSKCMECAAGKLKKRKVKSPCLVQQSQNAGSMFSQGVIQWHSFEPEMGLSSHHLRDAKTMQV